MERKGASYRITRSRSQQTDLQAGGMRPMHPWTATSNAGAHSFTNDTDAALALSVGRHPSGGYTAEASNYGWDKHDPEEFRAGPFRTPLRAQVAAESLGERTLGATREIDRYRKPRSR